VRIDYSQWSDEELLAEAERSVSRAKQLTEAACIVWSEYAGRKTGDLERVETHRRLLQSRDLLLEAYGKIRGLLRQERQS
jgi:hypothetical protein